MRRNYTRRQIVEAINYWKKQLNESDVDETPTSLTPEEIEAGFDACYKIEAAIDDLPLLSLKTMDALNKGLNTALRELQSMLR